MFEIIFTKEFYTVIHILGVALGAGGAFVSDAIFFHSVKDGYFSRVEIAFMHIGSKAVWVGLFLLFVSGIGIFLSDTDYYLASSKFLAKMSIVLIITLNGIIFHLLHIPRIRRHADEHFPSSDEFMRKSKILLASGALSVVSWLYALVLGSLKAVPYTFAEIFGVYVFVVIFAIAVAYMFRERVFLTSKKKPR